MKVEDIITKFSNYIFGYEHIKKPSIYYRLLNGKDLAPIFCDKSGSIVCVWKHGINENIVWIDSEGTPCNIFAENLDQFFEIIPYGPEFIYDYLSAIENHLLSPNLIPHPKSTFTIDYINETYLQIDTQLLGEYCEWLEENELSFNKNPILKINKIIESSNFSN